ncbi:YybH family protein [Isobaculum melis]|uniref:DUF4440 domain-containing protein n=1 Tax=Isobaculum melis TaxID=142588 RepID=A0A1H9TEN7_9LACT|nr:nuclear transport factor 2 family protein [Isobaculum melis]SER95790.1 protein of unknown function [Isobaculum melis]
MSDYKQALIDYINATNTHDFSEVEKCLAQNAVYWFSDNSCTTIDAIKEYFEQAWTTVQEEVYQADHVQWIATSSEVATCIYEYKWSGLVNGIHQSGKGRATNIFKQVDQKWLLIHEHLSA